MSCSIGYGNYIPFPSLKFELDLQNLSYLSLDRSEFQRTLMHWINYLTGICLANSWHPTESDGGLMGVGKSLSLFGR